MGNPFFSPRLIRGLGYVLFCSWFLGPSFSPPCKPSTAPNGFLTLFLRMMGPPVLLKWLATNFFRQFLNARSPLSRLLRTPTHLFPGKTSFFLSSRCFDTCPRFEPCGCFVVRILFTFRDAPATPGVSYFFSGLYFSFHYSPSRVPPTLHPIVVSPFSTTNDVPPRVLFPLLLSPPQLLNCGVPPQKLSSPAYWSFSLAFVSLAFLVHNVFPGWAGVLCFFCVQSSLLPPSPADSK